MPRLPAAIALVLAVAVTAFAALFLRTRGALNREQQRNAATTAELQSAHTALAEARASELAAAKRADESTAELARVRVQLTADMDAARRDLGQTRDVLELYETTAKALALEVSSLREELAAARASEASPEAVAAYRTAIAELERQLRAPSRNGGGQVTEGVATTVLTNRVGRATVLSVGPENAFVVLNFGTLRGAALGQKLVVNQGTDVVATVLISDVRSHFSIAQVLPDSLRGILHKGDSALLLR